MEYLDKVLEFAEKYPFSVAFMLIGLGLGYLIDNNKEV